MLAIGDVVLRSINFVLLVIALGLTGSLAATAYYQLNPQVNFAVFASAFAILTSTFTVSWHTLLLPLPGLRFWLCSTSWTLFSPLPLPLPLLPTFTCTLVSTMTTFKRTPLPKMMLADAERLKPLLLSSTSLSSFSWPPVSSPLFLSSRAVCLVVPVTPPRSKWRVIQYSNAVWALASYGVSKRPRNCLIVGLKAGGTLPTELRRPMLCIVYKI